MGKVAIREIDVEDRCDGAEVAVSQRRCSNGQEKMMQLQQEGLEEGKEERYRQIYSVSLVIGLTIHYCIFTKVGAWCFGCTKT